MILQKENEISEGGKADIWLILYDINKKTYHPCFVKEHPFNMSNESIEEQEILKLKSKMHHTTGFKTYEEALDNLENDAIKRLIVPENNIIKEPIDWDGNVFSIVVPNWIKENRHIIKKDIGSLV